MRGLAKITPPSGVISVSSTISPVAWPPLASSALPLSSTAASPPSASRSEEHTSELQSLMRISYAVFCLKKKINNISPSLIKQDQHNYNHQINPALHYCYIRVAPTVINI